MNATENATGPLQQELDQKQKEASFKALLLQLEQAENLALLEELRIKILGKQGLLTESLKNLKNIPVEQKAQYGAWINQYKHQFETLLKEKKQSLEQANGNKKGLINRLDSSLPARSHTQGSIHPVTWMRQYLETWFIDRGFAWAEGPEIEDDYHNFIALNFPENHPARDMQDTFYLEDGRLLRTHTSPLQVRILKSINKAKDLPLRCITTGRVYRCDSDMTHTPMFHQLEAFVVGKNINWGHLKDLIDSFLKELFGENLEYRFRSSYFPFTEPSAEVDILRNGQWMEVLGCGLIHPAILQECGLDTEIYTGLAMGIGLERLAMQRFNIPDLRWLFENDARLLRQFSV
ncbi:MAG: phenylalanine--tRNA ligase subunit alpha [Gammaproteobacteria bacterium]